MALFQLFDIAGSALSAQAVRLNVTASNLANAESASSSIERTYRAREPVFAPLLDEEGRALGVRVLGIVESRAPLDRRYEPGHPLADKEGYVFYPNVHPVEELANLISASRSYQTNVEVMDTGKRLLLKTLTLGR